MDREFTDASTVSTRDCNDRGGDSETDSIPSVRDERFEG